MSLIRFARRKRAPLLSILNQDEATLPKCMRLHFSFFVHLFILSFSTARYKGSLLKEGGKTVAVKQIKVKKWTPARQAEIVKEYDIIRQIYFKTCFVASNTYCTHLNTLFRAFFCLSHVCIHRRLRHRNVVQYITQTFEKHYYFLVLQYVSRVSIQD